MFSVFILLFGSSVLFCHSNGLDVPPTMKAIFKRNYYLADKGNVKFILSCTAEGTPDITYTWKVGGTTIVNHVYRTLYPNGTMFISLSNDTYNWYGDYQCFAQNSKGTAMSSVFSIKRAKLNGFPDTEVENLDTKNEYDYLFLKCADRPTCIPESSCRTEWKIGAGTDNSVIASDRIAFSEDGRMHFLYLTRNDQLPSGEFYGCGVWNQVLSLLTKGSRTTFLVAAAPDSDVVKEVKARDQKGATGLLTYSAKIQCIFSGYPVPTISWRKQGGNLIQADGVKYEMENYNRILVVNSLTKDDQMNYECTAEQVTTTGTNKASSSVYLNVTAPPQAYPNEMADLVATVGSDANFSCKTYSLEHEQPPVGPTWYFNGEKITQAEIGVNQKYTTRENNTILVVKNVQKSISGSIQCVTENSVGTFMRDATLVVIDPIEVQTALPASLEILPEGIKFLTVAATTDPLFTLSYSWFFTRDDGEKFHNSDKGPDFGSNFPPELTLSSDRRNLTLDGSNLEGGDILDLVGTYAVRIYHEHDELILVAEVFTDESILPAPVVTSSAGGFNPIIIAIILGVIVLFIVIFLIIFLLYRNRGGTYPLDKKELAAGHDPEKELADSGFQDLSRADGFDDEKPTNDRMSLNDSEKDYDSDDNFDQEYGDGDFDTTKFNEDGSFIGQYTDSKRRPVNQSVV